MLGFSTYNFGVLAIVSSFAPDAVHSPVAYLWKAILVCSTVVVGTLWLVKPFPGRAAVIGFGIYADVGTASTLWFNSPSDSLVICVLFAVIGTYCTFFLSLRWLAAHLAFAAACVTAMAVTVYVTGGSDLASLILRTNVILLVVIGVAPTSHLLVTVLSDDARSSQLDPLTGLLNRRGLDAALDDMAPLGREHDQCIAVVMVDIDRFKSVNDVYGHEEGDAVIVRVAQRLGAHMGDYGVLARTGGEEYLAVVSTSRLHVDALVHGIRRALRDPADTVAVTVSVGAAIVYWNSPLREQEVDIITRATRVADSMMYEAKAAGGNRVVTTLL